MSDFSLNFFAVAAGFMVSLCAMPLMMRLARTLNIVDRPAHRKIHTRPVPYLGGLGIFLALAGVFALLMSQPLHAAETAKALAIAGATGAAFLLGLADDKFNFSARYKFFAQILIVLFFTWFGYPFEVVNLPGLGQFNLYYLSIPFTALWILALVNAMNLIDGTDGLSASVAAIVLGTVALMGYFLEDRAVCILAVGGMAAVTGFLVYNWRPARIYMGDGGSLGLGMLIATCLVSLGKETPLMPIKSYLLRSPGEPYLYQITLITFMALYPFMELSLTVLRRFLQGKSLGSADKGHLHHRLMNRGWTADQICLAAMLISLVGAGASVFSLMQYRGISAWFLASSGLLIGLLLHYCGLLDVLHPQILGARPHFLLANHFISMQKIKLDFAEDVAELNALVAQTCLELGIETVSISVAPGPKQTEPSVFHWKRAPEIHGTMLPAHSAPRGKTHAMFRDQVGLVDSITRAEWVFEPAATEEDIDVEYRVLMSEFMRKALSKAEALYQALEPADLKAALNCQRPLSSMQLRRRSVIQRQKVDQPSARTVLPPESDIPPAKLQNN